jgi:hypothetical protein
MIPELMWGVLKVLLIVVAIFVIIFVIMDFATGRTE